MRAPAPQDKALDIIERSARATRWATVAIVSVTLLVWNQSIADPATESSGGFLLMLVLTQLIIGLGLASVLSALGAVAARVADDRRVDH